MVRFVLLFDLCESYRLRRGFVVLTGHSHKYCPILLFNMWNCSRIDGSRVCRNANRTVHAESSYPLSCETSLLYVMTFYR